MEITNFNPEEFPKLLQSLKNHQLLAHELMQQGAVHAVSHLLKTGATEENATAMLEQLRSQAETVRNEHKRRGTKPLFACDQTKST